MGDDRSRDSTGPDAGSPGGMGGVRASGGTGTDRPPGGISPLKIEQELQQAGEDHAALEEQERKQGEEAEEEGHPS
jgi:hypothetical protein